MNKQKLIVKLDIGNNDYSNNDGDEITIKNTKGERIGIGIIKGNTIEIELTNGSCMLKASNIGIGGVVTSRKGKIIKDFKLTELSIIK